MLTKTKKIVAIVIALLAVITFIVCYAPSHSYSSKLHNIVEVKDSDAQPSSFYTNLTVKEDGTYQISADWMNDVTPGFVTGLVVYSESGEAVFSITGGTLTADSTVMELDKGKYSFKFTTLGSKEAYMDYAREHFKEGEIGEIDADFFKPGTYEMDYSVSINESRESAKFISLICGAIVGLLIVALIIVASRKDTAVANKYDERQIAAQGIAYKYSFITMIVYYTVLALVSIMEPAIPVDNSLLTFLGVLIGGGVFITYVILKDAYFRLDENRTPLIVFFSIFSFLNIAVGIIHIVRKTVFENGMLTLTGTCNLTCGIFLLYMLVIIIIKGFMDKQED
ncbi:MAG: hypothetical protein K6E19_04050 [Lachnospiraceae bacterium]|nr:hypothetical protein [Lachnospiraceae bacterium]